MRKAVFYDDAVFISLKLKSDTAFYFCVCLYSVVRLFCCHIAFTSFGVYMELAYRRCIVFLISLCFSMDLVSSNNFRFLWRIGG